MNLYNIIVIHPKTVDSEYICSGIQEMGNEYKIELVENGSEALNKIQSGEFSLLITDCFLPDMTGVNLVRSARAINPNIKTFLTIPAKSQVLTDSMNLEEIDYILDTPISIAHMQYLIKKSCKEFPSTPAVLNIPDTPTMPTSTQLPNLLSMNASIDSACPSTELYEQLQDLKNNTNGRCVLLLSSSGHIIEHAGSTNQLNIDSISALVAANFMATSELAKLVGNQSIFKSSHHAGPNYDIYSSGINDEFLLVTIFGKQTKVGLVRFYVNKAVETLAPLVGNNLFTVDFSDSQIEACVQDELDLLFMP